MLSVCGASPRPSFLLVALYSPRNPQGEEKPTRCLAGILQSRAGRTVFTSACLAREAGLFVFCGGGGGGICPFYLLFLVRHVHFCG